MFRGIRRTKNELDISEGIVLLESNRRGALSVYGEDGYPYTIPVNFYYEDDHIYIHCAKKGHKLDSIHRNSKVCFTTWNDGILKDDWAYYVSSVVCFGQAKIMEDKEQMREMIWKLGCKYYPNELEVKEEIDKDFDFISMIDIDIEHMSVKQIHER